MKLSARDRQRVWDSVVVLMGTSVFLGTLLSSALRALSQEGLYDLSWLFFAAIALLPFGACIVLLRRIGQILQADSPES